MNDKLFYPAIALMNRLSYFKKFMLILGLLALPGAGLLYLLTQEHDQRINFTSKELVGVQYNWPLRTLVEGLQRHRELSMRFFAGDSSVPPQIRQLEAQIDQTVARGDQMDTELGDNLGTRERWKSVRMNWRNLKGRFLAQTEAKNDELHAALGKETLELLVHVADNSNLTLDPDIDSHYLMNITTANVLQLTEVLTELKILLMRMQKNTLADGDRTGFTVKAGIVRSHLSGISNAVTKVYSVNTSIASVIDPSFVDLKATTDELLDVITAEVLSGQPAPVPRNYPDLASRAIAAGFKLYDTQSRMLSSILLQRVEKYSTMKAQTLILTPLVFLVVMYLLMGFYRSVRRTVGSLETVARQLSSGSITGTVSLESRDELGLVGSSFNHLAVSIINRNKLLEENKLLLEASNKQLRDTQAALVQGEKMASLGQMVAGIAHEVNTPLGYVKNNVEMMIANQVIVNEALTKYRLLLEMLVNGQEDGIEKLVEELAEVSNRLEQDSIMGDIETMLTHALSGTERIQELIRNLRDFSRLDEADVAKIDVNKAIDSTLVIARSTIKNKAQVRKDYQQNLVAECYPAQFNQVILNLLVNAAQAIEADGVISIKTYKEPGDPDMAVIRISDTGKGIPKEHLARIFEPFFTTKPVGEGTGLGLSIAYKIIEKHGGSISVNSIVGEGTEFTIRIPVAQKKLSKQPRAA